jgi:hypothetical protein
MDQAEEAKTPPLAASELTNIFKFPGKKEADPLKDPSILRMLRLYHAAGVKSTFTNPKHLGLGDDPIDSISEHDAQQIGLTCPTFLVRAPSSARTEELNKLRHRAETPSLRITAMVVGAWLNNQRMDSRLLGRFLTGSLTKNVIGNVPNLGLLLSCLQEDGFISIEPNGHIFPTRVLLYRAIESIAWILDILAPLCEEFQGTEYASKFEAWPDIRERIPESA